MIHDDTYVWDLYYMEYDSLSRMIMLNCTHTHTHQFAVVAHKHGALSVLAQPIARDAQILDELQIILRPRLQFRYAAPVLRCGCNKQLTGNERWLAGERGGCTCSSTPSPTCRRGRRMAVRRAAAPNRWWSSGKDRRHQPPWAAHRNPSNTSARTQLSSGHLQQLTAAAVAPLHPPTCHPHAMQSNLNWT